MSGAERTIVSDISQPFWKPSGSSTESRSGNTCSPRHPVPIHESLRRAENKPTQAGIKDLSLLKHGHFS